MKQIEKINIAVCPIENGITVDDMTHKFVVD